MRFKFWHIIFVVLLQAFCLEAVVFAASGSGSFALDSHSPQKATQSRVATIPFYLQGEETATAPFIIESDPFGVTLRIVTSLIAIIILAFALSWFLQKKAGFGGNVFGKVLGILPLDNRKYIYLIDIMGRVLVLGVTENNINFLCEITDKTTIDSLRLQNDSGSLPGMEKIFSFLNKKNKSPEENFNEPGERTSTEILGQTSLNRDRLKKINDLLVKRDSETNKKD